MQPTFMSVYAFKASETRFAASFLSTRARASPRRSHNPLITTPVTLLLLRWSSGSEATISSMMAWTASGVGATGKNEPRRVISALRVA